MLEHRALAILGPVGQRESMAAARRAAELGVPIGLLAPADRGGSPGAGVFRLWSSAAWEARAAARLALDMGYDRLAVLAPRDEQGAEAAAAFTAAAAAAGVEIVAAGTYDPTAAALEPDIKTFLGLDPAVNGRLRQHLRRTGRDGWKTFSPDVAFDLLYVPDDYDRAALVAAYLPYFNVEVRSRDVMDILYLKRKHGGRVPQVVQLMGSSGWHHESLIPRGGPAVEGALVVDVFSGGENESFATEEGARFAEQYQARHGRPASALSAQAYDATLLVLAAQREVVSLPAGRSDAPRKEFARALGRAAIDGGACGPARMGAGGEIERDAIVLRVDGGAFVLHEY